MTGTAVFLKEEIHSVSYFRFQTVPKIDCWMEKKRHFKYIYCSKWDIYMNLHPKSVIGHILQFWVVHC